jgi:hypothetical protein
MRFILLLHGDEPAELAMSDEQRRAVLAAHGVFAARLRDAGVLIGGEPLAPSDRSVTVRHDGRAGRPIVSDGPYAETKEQLGGYYVLDCADRDEAVRYAREVPPSPGLVVEVRPISGM